MAKTIADLGKQDSEKPVVGRSMLDDGRKPIDQRILELIEKRKAEEAFLESGGYDYGSNEQWARAMRNVGRK